MHPQNDHTMCLWYKPGWSALTRTVPYVPKGNVGDGCVLVITTLSAAGACSEDGIVPSRGRWLQVGFPCLERSGVLHPPLKPWSKWLVPRAHIWVRSCTQWVIFTLEFMCTASLLALCATFWVRWLPKCVFRTVRNTESKWTLWKVLHPFGSGGIVRLD